MNKYLVSGMLLSQLVFANQTLNYSVEFGSSARGLSSSSEWEEVPGMPIVPRLTKRILLPFKKKLKRVTFSEEMRGRSFQKMILPRASIPRPLCDVKYEVVKDKVFNATESYPGRNVGDIQIINKHGFNIAYIPLYPVQYFPESSEAIVSIRGNLELELEDTVESGIYRGLEEDKREVLRLTDTDEFLESYPERRVNELAQYLVIGPKALLDNGESTGLSAFLNEKNARGITTLTLSTEEISANTAGSSIQEKIRNAIIKSYKENATKYVLLLGNGYSSTPSKTLSSSQGSVLADYYYACLSGTFRAAAKDSACEVAVGRFPATTPDDLKVLIEKTKKLANLDANDPRIKNGLLFGEKLDSSTYGGKTLEQLAVGGKTGSIKTQGYPADNKFARLYESSNKTFAADEVIKTINSGDFYTINHFGHANQTYCMRFKSTAISGLTNSLPFFGITQGCHPGDLHGANWTASLMTFAGGGAGAMISNSGFGWYQPGSTDGPSTKQQLLFYDTAFKEGIRELGKIHYRTKERMIPDMSQGIIRYVVYETNLFGDPELRLKF